MFPFVSPLSVLMFYGVPMSDFLSVLMSSVQLDMAAVRPGLKQTWRVLLNEGARRDAAARCRDTGGGTLNVG